MGRLSTEHPRLRGRGAPEVPGLAPRRPVPRQHSDPFGWHCVPGEAGTPEVQDRASGLRPAPQSHGPARVGSLQPVNRAALGPTHLSHRRAAPPRPSLPSGGGGDPGPACPPGRRAAGRSGFCTAEPWVCGVARWDAGWGRNSEGEALRGAESGAWGGPPASPEPPSEGHGLSPAGGPFGCGRSPRVQVGGTPPPPGTESWNGVWRFRAPGSARLPALRVAFRGGLSGCFVFFAPVYFYFPGI